MRLKSFRWGLLAAGLSFAAAAQSPGVGGLPVPVPTLPVSAALINCQGGTGSTVATVGTTATLVCAAGTARSYWRIANMNPAGGAYVYCTDDGSTPTLTHWTFIGYPQGYQDSLGMPVVSPAAIACIASVASGITALAVQTGAAP
jgi:hypothetical protein